MPQVSAKIVGAQHHEGAQTKLNTLRAGHAVELRREPDNPYDQRAVQCWVDGVFLGYIPKRQNPQIAEAIDRGELVRCRIYPVQPNVIVQWPSVVQPNARMARG
jgi:HIRAN domain